jgi:hypothetical protein
VSQSCRASGSSRHLVGSAAQQQHGCPPSLGYEHHDARLCCLGWSTVFALTSTDLRREVRCGPLRLRRFRLSRDVRFTNRFTEPVLHLRVSTVQTITSARVVIHRPSLFRPDEWHGAPSPVNSSVSGCRCSGSGTGLTALTWAYARCALLGLPYMSCVYPCGPWRSRAVVGPSLGPWTPSSVASSCTRCSPSNQECGLSPLETGARGTIAACRVGSRGMA